jgi:hypothetical protein
MLAANSAAPHQPGKETKVIDIRSHGVSPMDMTVPDALRVRLIIREIPVDARALTPRWKAACRELPAIDQFGEGATLFQTVDRPNAHLLALGEIAAGRLATVLTGADDDGQVIYSVLAGRPISPAASRTSRCVQSQAGHAVAAQSRHDDGGVRR